MFDLERWKDNFKNHIATLTDYGDIKVLDFKNPKSSIYRMRFLFEADYCRLHISGDLGELIATNYYNMTYEKFSDFSNNIGYFMQKIECHSRPLYYFDEKIAKEDLKKFLEEHDIPDYEIDDITDCIMFDFSLETGLGSQGLHELSEAVLDEVWDFAKDMGRRETGILDVYMLAFNLAKKQIDGKEKSEEK